MKVYLPCLLWAISLFPIRFSIVQFTWSSTWLSFANLPCVCCSAFTSPRRFWWCCQCSFRFWKWIAFWVTMSVRQSFNWGRWVLSEQRGGLSGCQSYSTAVHQGIFKVRVFPHVIWSTFNWPHWIFDSAHGPVLRVLSLFTRFLPSVLCWRLRVWLFISVPVCTWVPDCRRRWNCFEWGGWDFESLNKFYYLLYIISLSLGIIVKFKGNS